VKLNAIARQAGVGQGTLYRHFPTREDLLAEVYREDVDELVAAAPDVDARDVILLIGYLTRLEQSEWDTRARHLLQVILDGLRRPDPGLERARGR